MRIALQIEGYMTLVGSGDSGPCRRRLGAAQTQHSSFSKPSARYRNLSIYRHELHHMYIRYGYSKYFFLSIVLYVVGVRVAPVNA